jgi:hypothetical protein
MRRHLRVLPSAPAHDRPKTRSECANGPRPCPYVSCRYHLFLDVTETGSITFSRPGVEVDELEHSCALDVAESGELELRKVGALMGISHGRVDQIAERAFRRLLARGFKDPR